MKILSTFNSPSSCSKPILIYFCWTQNKIFGGMFVLTTWLWGTIDFHSMENKEFSGAPQLFGYKHSINSNRFKTTQGWVNDGIIYILGWTRPIPLISFNFPYWLSFFFHYIMYIYPQNVILKVKRATGTFSLVAWWVGLYCTLYY